MYKQSYFETLNQALESEGLIDIWPISKSISYGETARLIADDEETFIIIYRHNQTGRYERPIHYKVI